MRPQIRALLWWLIWPCDPWRCGHSSRSGHPRAGWCDQKIPWPHNWSWGGSGRKWHQLGDRKTSAEAGSDLLPTDCWEEAQHGTMTDICIDGAAAVCFPLLQKNTEGQFLTGQLCHVRRRQNSTHEGKSGCPTLGNCGLCSPPDK